MQLNITQLPIEQLVRLIVQQQQIIEQLQLSYFWDGEKSVKRS
jgi:hypothetical protein